METIDRLQGQAAEQQTELAIGGMTCASCVAHVSRALRKVPGVIDAHVNLASERASIKHTAGVGAADLLAAVEKAGYDASVAPLGEPTDDSDAARRDRETASRLRLLILAIALSVPEMLLGMLAPQFPGKDWLMFLLTLPVWAVVGWSFHRSAVKNALHGAANMDTLVSLGSTAAFAYSIYATIAMRPAYYETTSAIITLIFLGKYLEARAKGKSNSAIRALLDLRPNLARVQDAGGRVQEVPIEAVQIGDVLMVPPGERIPIDGIVIEGRSAVDVSMLTGEPIPHEVEPGTQVQAGTLNGDGTLVVRATAVGAGTVLSRIVEIVRQAQGSTPPVQRLADRVAGIFVPTILAIAAITFLSWLATGHMWVQALIVAVAVLVVACPCALGLATPMAIMVAMGVGAKRGMLFKDASALEQIGTATAVVFDKTGTLTAGLARVVAVRTLNGRSESDVLSIAAAVERGSSHPLASAIVLAAEESDVPYLSASTSVAERGAGVRALVSGATVLAGTGAFLERNGVATIPVVSQRITSAASIVYVASDGEVLGWIEIADPVRAESAHAIEMLHKLGIATFLVSGDAPGAVHAVADLVRIPRDNVRAQASPSDKAAFVQALHARNEQVVFVGDGINDAPALATADVGIAMGGGTEIAMETAQAAILSNDPRAAATAIRLSRGTMRTIKQNLFWAFAYNIVLVPLAALGIVQPIYAAAAMGLSSLFVAGNSLLLRRHR
jgi:Cu+-exporting ATPase